MLCEVLAADEREHRVYLDEAEDVFVGRAVRDDKAKMFVANFRHRWMIKDLSHGHRIIWFREVFVWLWSKLDARRVV